MNQTLKNNQLKLFLTIQGVLANKNAIWNRKQDCGIARKLSRLFYFNTLCLCYLCIRWFSMLLLWPFKLPQVTQQAGFVSINLVSKCIPDENSVWVELCLKLSFQPWTFDNCCKDRNWFICVPFPLFQNDSYFQAECGGWKLSAHNTFAAWKNSWRYLIGELHLISFIIIDMPMLLGFSSLVWYVFHVIFCNGLLLATFFHLVFVNMNIIQNITLVNTW